MKASSTSTGRQRTDCNHTASHVKKRILENERGGGKFRKVFTNPELAPFTPRQLMDELKARGYSGTLKYVETIEI